MNRRYYLDWLRVFAICLVIVHHAGQAYGPTGGEWMVEEPIKSNLLAPFFGVNAGFGMAFFFMLAGFFVPPSLDRKGPWQFSIDRLRRLGIPLVIIGFLVFPLIIFLMEPVEMSFAEYYIEGYLEQGNLTFGHLWFVFHLIVYSIAFAVAWPGLRGMLSSHPSPPGHGILAAFTAIILALTSIAYVFWTRDQWLNVLGVFPIEFVHLPQYLAMFLFGVLAGANGWLDTLSDKIAFSWFKIGIGAAVFWYMVRYLHIYADILLLPAIYGWMFPLWEGVLCVGLCVGFVGFARRYWEVSNPVLPRLVRASYGVFIIHIFVVGLIQIAILPFDYPPFTKFLFVSAISIPLCFVLVMGFQALTGIFLNNRKLAP